MNLDDYGYFDGDVYVFHEPFPFIDKEGVTLLRELNYASFTKYRPDVEGLVSHVLKKQLGIPDPLRQREPHQETPKKDPGE